MRPNVSSGCCTLENAANAASVRNLQVYPLPPGANLHSNPHSHHHQQAQQQQNHIHRIHSQQHFSLQQQFKPQAPTAWFPPQSLYNAVPHPSNASKAAANGRHQGIPFVAPQPPALIQSHGQQLIPAAPQSHSHQQHQYQQYHCSLQQQKHQSTHFPQKPQCVLQSTSTVSGAHPFSGYLPANTPHTRPTPDQLSVGASSAGPPHSASFTKLASTSVVNQQRVNECAGIPLISNSTTHLAANQRQRVQRKLSRSPGPHQKLSAVGGIDPTYKPQHPCVGLYMARSANAASCSHISQLAAHAQGAPLLLNKQYQQQQQCAAPKWPMTHSTSNTFQSAASSHCSLNAQMASVGTAVKSNTEKASRATLRYQHSAPAALSTRGKESTTQTTQVSTASSEAIKHSTEAGDTALPRIIKPRKRRKKDRKPTTNAVLLKLDAAAASGATSEIARDCSQEMPALNMQQSQLMLRQPQELQRLQHKSYLYPHQDSNENLYKFINFYLGTQQPMDNADSTHVFNSNLPLLDYKPRGILPSPCLKSPGCVSGIRHKQCDASRDEHSICVCRHCDPLRSIWDYPLRRSLSDSSAASIRTHSSSSSSSSSSSQASSTETASSSCSSAPLTDGALSPSTALSRAHRVGVIGSNRNCLDSNRDVAKHTEKGCEIFGGRTTTNGCLSDSNDSGYGDILSGINIADDFFSQSTYNMSTALTSLLATTHEPVLDVRQSAADQSMKTAQMYGCGTETLLPLLPATADALLTESINEISRKLIETCGSELSNEFTGAATRSQSAYSRCSSDFSADSGIDSAAIVNCDELVFKFDNLNFMIDVAKDTASDNNNNNYLGTNNSELAATAGNSFSELLKLPITATGPETAECINKRNFFNDATNLNLLFDLNNNENSIFEFEPENERESERERERLRKALHEKQQQHDQQFINNCFDLVWPTTFENCMRKTVTKILDMDVEKQLAALPHPEIA
ncbi:uncharacterized protein LOC118737476 [Rhagoletis pomonella]|uniref:uncharacterized protein LOC118737476 n=1 Tax=Rhagoletis pomonella TaxID=28610 RepID=UPI00177E75FF|nr:uncharacterized protein LOC118737476 [Rhagoletis pomonella]